MKISITMKLLFTILSLLIVVNLFGQNNRAITSQIVDNNEVAKKLAPDFEMTMEDGSKKKLSDFKGQVVYISFWASWCGPCIQGFNKYRGMREDVEKLGVVMLNVSVDKDKEQWKAAIEKHQPTGIHAHVPRDEVRELYELYSIPVYEIIGKNGQFHYLSEGADRNILESFKRFVKL